MKARQNITFAIFDVRPIDRTTGQTDFDFINSLKANLDLSNRERKVFASEMAEHSILAVSKPAISSGSEELLAELQVNLAQTLDLKKEVKAFGGVVIDAPAPLRQKALRIKPAKKEKDLEFDNLKDFRKEFSKIFSPAGGEEAILTDSKTIVPPPYLPWAPHLRASEEWGPEPRVLNLSPAARELDAVIEGFKPSEFQASVGPVISISDFRDKISGSVKYFASGLVILFMLSFLGLRFLNIKTGIVENSSQAYLNLSLARNSLFKSDFFEAASSFALAAENFEVLQDDLSKAGSLFKVLNTLTLGSVSNVSKLVEAGELISQAGTDIGRAINKINEVNFVSVIQEGAETNILEVLSSLRLDLVQAGRNINQAQALLSGVDLGFLPESERMKFEDLRSELPRINDFMAKAVEYPNSLMAILGQSGPQRYLVLFQNTSELRPTGGFPGSYALIEFENGVMKEFFVDDIYNPDGQMKEKIIPPQPLQKITPNWGLRDSNWFPDFELSAKKAAEFYYKDTKILVDGVIAVNVDLVPEVLKITGPIEMPDFGVVLNSDNFLAEVQEEVEYLKTKGQPKEILVEFAPKFLERLSSLSQEDWIKVFALLVEAVDKKDILAYFVDSRLQNFAVSNGLAGKIEDVDSDYLMVVHSNVMGSKTDAVIDNSVYLKIEKDPEGDLVHTLEIERRHNGGQLGFYNKKNNDYIRILLPEDAELIGVSGNDFFDTSPIVNYDQAGFVSDPDLERYESRIGKTGGIESFNDSGKKVFAFWMTAEPRQTKKAVIRYKTSDYGSLYVQRQPGAKSGLKAVFEGKTLFDESLSSDKNITLE